MIAASLFVGAFIGVVFVEAVFRMQPRPLYAGLRMLGTAGALVTPALFDLHSLPFAIASFIVTKNLWLTRKATTHAAR